MSDNSAAQRLPQHVLEAIIGYLSIDRSGIGPLEQSPLPRMRLELLPFMHTCRTWRYVGCSEFYQNVFLRVHADDYIFSQWAGILEMRHAACLNQLHHVRVICTYLIVTAFDTQWDGDTPNISSLLCAYGQLPNVRGIHLDFGYIIGVFDEEEGFDSRRVVQNISAFVRSIRTTVPRTCRITLDAHCLNAHSDMERFFYEELAGSADLFVDKRGVSLSQVIIGMMPPTLSLPLLRELTLISHYGDEVVGLMKRYAGTLERLHILKMTTQSALELTTRHVHGGHETLVYPRLKHLYLDCGGGLSDPIPPQPLVDPFPQLETLICKGPFPFSTPVVLADGQSHLRHLEIDIDTRTLEMLANRRVFVPGAFTKLHHITINWSGREPFYASCGLLYRSLELFQEVHVMRLHYISINNIEQPKALLSSMDNLQVLDLGYTFLTLEQLVEILTACPCLQKANVHITRAMLCPNDEDRLDVAAIRKYRRRYGARTASVRYLGCVPVVDIQKDRSAELLVLLVDILGSVSRVCAGLSQCSYTYRFLDIIQNNVTWHIYQDRPHVQECRFILSDSW